MTLTVEAIYASLAISQGDEITIVAHWTKYDVGMDPVTTVIYDRRYDYYRGEGDPGAWRGVERRIVIVQGTRGLFNGTLDYMEGW